MGNFGIKVTGDSTNINEAGIEQTLLNSKDPLMKLDRANSVSFQNIRIFFANEPPVPAANTTTTTLLYKFKHGYDYTPAIWSYCRFDGAITTYFVDSGTIAGTTTGIGTSYAQIFTGADSAYCYIYIFKYTGPLAAPVYVAGSALNFRFYVFAQDVGV